MAPRPVFLLGNDGNSVLLLHGQQADPATLDDPLYHLQIGSPTGLYVVPGAGIYIRNFTNGKAMVNTTVVGQLGGSSGRAQE